MSEQPPANSEASLTVRIAGTEQRHGQPVLKLETRVGETLTKTEFVGVDDAGLHCYERTIGEGKAALFDPPQTTLPAPLKPGVTWEFDGDAGGSPVHQKFTVTSDEAVTVPAGTYHAYRMHCDQPWPIAIGIDRWFAPGVGFVKEVTSTRGPTGRLLSRVTQELKALSQTAPPPTSTSTPEPPTSSATAEPTDTPSPQPAKASVEVAAERDAEAQTDFRSDVPNIFVRWSGENLPTDRIARVAWVAEDVGDLAPANFVIDETETRITRPDFNARFTLSRPRDGWAAGKYRVDLFIDDVLVQSVHVAIHD